MVGIAGDTVAFARQGLDGVIQLQPNLHARNCGPLSDAACRQRACRLVTITSMNRLALGCKLARKLS